MFHSILMGFFAIIGVLGIIYQVETAVFIGMLLLPFQMIKLRKNEKIVTIFIALTSLIATIFFIYIKRWDLLVFFLLIATYNYYLNLKVKETLDK